MTEIKRKEYHHNYYMSHYKDIIKDKKTFCSVCQCEVCDWSIYKHNRSKRHMLNSMTEQERQDYDATQHAKKIERKMERKKQSLMRQLERLNTTTAV